MKTDEAMNKSYMANAVDLRCRSCSSILNGAIVKLKDMPLTDDFLQGYNVTKKEYVKDICIHECHHCGLVQNPADFDHEGYYEDYQYSSGHSEFVKSFMSRYARSAYKCYEDMNGKAPTAVIEIGSGDGEQLKKFRDLGVATLLGVEPSAFLAEVANRSGIPTHVGLFDAHIKKLIAKKFDICLSSYTLDHVRNPVEYLQTAWSLLNAGGILAFEVHSLEHIIRRTEFCLFEHEHTIYLTPQDAIKIVQRNGFTVIATDPIPADGVRGNSLIILARKECSDVRSDSIYERFVHNAQLDDLSDRIQSTVRRMEIWVDSLPEKSSLVGFGAGGRGVMTLAALRNADRFCGLFDSNFISDRFLTPKTRIPVIGPADWHRFSDSHCLVFSFGYFDEIRNQLAHCGFREEKLISLKDFFPG